MADKRQLTRRSVLASLAGAGTAALGSAFTSNGAEGNLYGGNMALSEAYNIAGELWIGPDSARSNVDPNTGRVYMASDDQVEYHGDGSSWVKMGVGSSQNPVPSVTTDEAHINEDALDLGKNAAANPASSSGAPLALGKGATAEGDSTTAVGSASTAENTQDGDTPVDATAVGNGAHADGDDTLAVGLDAHAFGAGAVALGKGSRAEYLESHAIGSAATCGASKTIAYGHGSEAASEDAHVLGHRASATTAPGALVAGYEATSTAYNGIALGKLSEVTAGDAVAIGQSTSVSTVGVGRIGVSQFVFGATRDTIADADLNTSEMTVEMDETNSAFRLRGKDSNGTVREATIAW